MDKKVAILDKCPSNINYKKWFDFDFELFHLSSQKVKRLLKRDVDLEGFDPDNFDFVILVGSEAGKMYKVPSITDYTGKLFESKFLPAISPAALHFKPEIAPVWEGTVAAIKGHIEGTVEESKIPTDYAPIDDEMEAIKYILSDEVQNAELLALDSETSALYCRDGFLLGISISHSEYQGRYIDADVLSEEFCMYLQNVLRKHGQCVFHNKKFDIHWYRYHLGIDFTGVIVHDTLAQHYVLDERMGTHGLKSLVMKYTDMGDYDFELDQFKKDYIKRHKMKAADFTYDLIPFDIMWRYACLSKESLVHMADGSWEKIADLVNSKSTKEVLTYNEATREVEAKPIVGWVKNPHPNQEWYKIFYHLQSKGLQKSTRLGKETGQGPAFTPDHKVYTQRGYVEVQDLVENEDRILTEELEYSEDSKQILWGSLMGDGALESRNKAGAMFRGCQSLTKKDYIELKSQALWDGSVKQEAGGTWGFCTNYNYQLTDLYHELPTRKNTVKYKLEVTDELLDQMDERALAIWYFDDGNLPKGSKPRIWSRTLSDYPEQVNKILQWLSSLGISARYHDDKVNNQFFVIEDEDTFFKLIAKYATPSVAYKIREPYRNLSYTYKWDFDRTENYLAKVKEVWKWEPNKRGFATSYCLEVKGNRNFFTKVGLVHNCGDTDGTLRLHNKFFNIIQANERLYNVYMNIMLPGLDFLQEMEDNGAPINVKRLERAKEYLANKLKALEEEYYGFPEVKALEERKGDKFNPNSVNDLRTLFFDIIGLPTTGKLTDTGADSTDAEVLKELSELHPLPKLVMEYKQARKFLNTYVLKILAGMDKDSRIRTGFNLTSTTSGRLSSSGKLNLQQLPRDDGLIKGCIEAPEGYSIVQMDLQTAEMWVAAALSGDKNLQQIFRDADGD